MSNLLDDHSEEQLAEEQLEQVRALALVFVAKCLVTLFFKLQPLAFLINVNYVWWVLIGVEVVGVQRALYAFYRCKDGKLLLYLRLFYIGIGLFCLVVALVHTAWGEGELFLYICHQVLLIFLDGMVALLLVRYYFNKLESPQYWLFMEHLLQWCWGIVLFYKVLVYLLYHGELNSLLYQPIFLPSLALIFKGSLVIAAIACGGLAYKKIDKKNRVLAFLSLGAVICWMIGIYFDNEQQVVLESLLFAGTIMAVLAYASSFSSSSEVEN